MSMAFGMGRDFYRRCKFVVCCSYGPPKGNNFITCRPKLSYNFFYLFSLLSLLFFWSRKLNVPNIMQIKKRN